MYQVVTDDEVNEQATALPDQLLPYYAQLLDLLELAPWRSEPYNDAKPDGALRTLRFGPADRAAAAVFLILEREQRVEIVRIFWLH